MARKPPRPMNIVKLLGLTPMVPRGVPDPELPIVGIELELENVRFWEEWLMDGFIRKEDGSLRNNGSEFITEPMDVNTLIKALNAFYEKNKISEKNISERCSVHVHLNCQDLTIQQVATLCKVYQVCERLLFLFVGDERDKNIFCVPWHQTNITSVGMFKEPLVPARFKTWYKYTALNLLPLFSLGTIEFRHLAGQPNVEKIVTWLNIIKSMWEFVISHPAEEIDNILLGLNTTSQYDRLVDQIFGPLAKHFHGASYKEVLEEGVLALKYMLFDNFTKTKDPDIQYYLDEMPAIRNEAVRPARVTTGTFTTGTF